MGWSTYKNGALLSAAEADGFGVFLTMGQNIEHQQNLSGRTIAVLVLVASSNGLEDLILLVPRAEPVLPAIQPGQIVRVEIPAEPEASS